MYMVILAVVINQPDLVIDIENATSNISGRGVIISKDEVLTVSHLIKDINDKVVLTRLNKKYEAIYHAKHYNLDVARLKLKNGLTFKEKEFPKIKQGKELDWKPTFYKINGVEYDFNGWTTGEIVSDKIKMRGFRLIRQNNFGDSGLPVYDNQNNLVGLVSGKRHNDEINTIVTFIR